MARIVKVTVEPLTPETFAPFGEVVGPTAAETVSLGAYFQLWRNAFDVEGGIELMFGRYLYRPMRFYKMERHLAVTQSFLPLDGGRSVMVVAAPTERTDPEALPQPEAVHAFHLDGSRGVMLWKGTWHALDRFPVSPPHADFAFLTGQDTQRELEQQALEGTPPTLTQLVDFDARMGVAFEIIDPQSHLAPG
ncbi:MAG: ureidoglycolate lyase [Alphaproteobacteria bacterium]|nr:ureidoglycolate lyase [Alphaproteobacteria bacterium]